ncbi:MAG: hypothetical protein JXB50_00685 [Spirochaetes bacterium]|nr:hypothetical protein [Spirochaetota bacterium]
MLKHQAFFHFFGSLNDFLSDEKKGQSFVYNFKGIASVKNLFEAIGVPHPEIRKITVNNRKKDFIYKVKDNDLIKLCPFNYGINKFFLSLLSIFASIKIKFIIDVHLGKLGKYLKLCGFDVLYNWKWDDDEIIKLASSQNRIILTHDIGLLKNKKVIKGYWIRSQYPDEQIIEVIERYHLLSKIKPFKRCLHCNNILIKIPKSKIKDKIPLMIYRKYKLFFFCLKCNKIYWRGSHYYNMKKFIKRLKIKY